MNHLQMVSELIKVLMAVLYMPANHLGDRCHIVVCEWRRESAAGGGQKLRHSGHIYPSYYGVSNIFHLLNIFPGPYRCNPGYAITFSAVSGAAGTLSADNSHR